MSVCTSSVVPLFIALVFLSFSSHCNGQDCTGLPDDEFLRLQLQSLVTNEGGEGPVTVTVQDGPFYTCKVQGTTMGTYQELSVILTYTTNNNNSPRSRQFELDCITSGGMTGWDRRTGSLSGEMDASIDYSSLGTFTNCSECTSSAGNDNHCQACDSACNFGLMRCTGTTATDCCVAFEDDGMCRRDLNCTENNFEANEQNNFTCSCEVSCDPGYVVNSTDCTCVLDNICETVPSPCNNGGNCTLTAAPRTFTCDCTGTGYTGDNCSVLVTTSIMMPSRTTSMLSTSTTSSTRGRPTTMTTSTSTRGGQETPGMSPSSTGRPLSTEQQKRLIYPFIISAVVGLLMLIVLVAAIVYVIYYFVTGKGLAVARTKPNAPFSNGESHNNPLYLKPDEVTSEVANLYQP